MIVIGEKINATIKSVGEAIEKRDADFIARLAAAQDKAGADYIDINAGNTGEDGMKWLVKTVQAATEKPLSIDSDDPAIIEAGLSVCDDRTPLMVNSATAETERLQAVGKMAAERSANLIALTIDFEGIPNNVERRIKDCDIIMEALKGMGMNDEQIYFDPLVLPVSVDLKVALVTLETIQEIKERYPDAKTAVGLSNISYGLPSRRALNRAFLMMATQAGLDAAILDPLDKQMMSTVRIAKLLGGQDANSRSYIKAYRNGEIVK